MSQPTTKKAAAEFRIYDMENPQAAAEIIKLADLPTEYYRLQFLVNRASQNIKREMELSLAAGEIVGRIYNALLKEYRRPTDEKSLQSLNKLCVRLVFCLYADDAAIFGRRGMFHEYLNYYAQMNELHNLRYALIRLFSALATPLALRDPYLDKILAAFPYVDGGLFEDEYVEIPHFSPKFTELLLKHASADFDWSGISPTIFGAVFESTLNPVTRRAGGMHYTSIENIHKVIDPLFLDDLKNEVLKELMGVQITMGDFDNPIKVSISQFYGIELNDFAVTVARTALWIAEAQMLQETENIVHLNLDFLPLKSYHNIVENNALRLDWNEVIPKEECNYIMGNPPFVGARLMSAEQKADIEAIFAGWKNSGNLDYVSCWYKKTADFSNGTNIRAALVSTNSVTQGDAVAILWKPLFAAGIHIDFAHRTFRWDSESATQTVVWRGGVYQSSAAILPVAG